MTPVFGTLLGLWAFVPDCSYEEAKKINLDPETQAGLIAKADYYHYQVQCRADEILNGALENGVRIMVMQVVRFWPEYVKIKQLRLIINPNKTSLA